jgi:hypothetical protein
MQAIKITYSTSKSRFTKNLLKNSNCKTEHSGFLGTETMKSSNQVPNKFDTNLELLKIAYEF